MIAISGTLCIHLTFSSSSIFFLPEELPLTFFYSSDLLAINSLIFINPKELFFKDIFTEYKTQVDCFFQYFERLLHSLLAFNCRFVLL